MASSYFPANYKPAADQPAAASRYFKPSSIPAGETVTLRLCGTPDSGHVIAGYQYFTEAGQPRRFQEYPENYMDDIGPTYDAKQKGTGEKAKPVFFLSWACLMKDAPDFKILDITQATVREAIERILDMEDYDISSGEMANFSLDIGRTGKGMDTRYSVMPTLKVASAEHVKLWHQQRDGIWLPALFEGGDPFAGRPSGAVARAGMPITSRDELGADTQIGSDW